jgi:hypothetical protein
MALVIESRCGKAEIEVAGDDHGNAYELRP